MKRIELSASVNRGAKRSLAALFMAGAMVVATPDRANATPIYSTCYPGNELGAYNWAYDEYGNFSDFIEINECALDSMGAGPEDRARVLEHELEHTQGYDHSGDPYDVMFPQTLVTGY